MFLRGFCENVVPDCGFLMVKLWWNAGERWSEDGLNSPGKSMPLILDLFSCFPFWETEHDARERGTMAARLSGESVLREINACVAKLPQ